MFIIIIVRTKLICFHVGVEGGGACIRQGVFIREGCHRRGIY